MNIENYQKLVEMHNNVKPVILYNTWNVATAKAIEKNGGKVIATSSYAIADSLGYNDGEEVPFMILKKVVENIANHTTIPITIDIETGYSKNIDVVLENILTLVKLGVVGINIEDQILGSVKYALEDIEKQSNKIRKIINSVEKTGNNIFINARTDIFLKEKHHTSETVQKALIRCYAYKEAGAMCIFIPGLTDIVLIREFVKKSPMPVNIMISAESPTISELKKVGVKRISFGPYSYFQSTLDYENRLKEVLNDYK